LLIVSREMKAFACKFGVRCAGVGLSLAPAFVLAAEVPFNPFEWAGSVLIIALAVVSVGLIAEASSDVIDAGLKVAGYEKKLSPEEKAQRDLAIKRAGAREEAAKYQAAAVPLVSTTSALEQLQLAQAAKLEGEDLEPVDPKA